MTEQTFPVIALLNETRLTLYRGDITKQAVDAIVNAANRSLLGGGGVDGAIHRAAGPLLLVECMTLRGCATGEAKITKGYKLPARYVIHAVGPVYGTPDDAQLLADAYKNSLARALEKDDIRTVAFPAISTGVYGYPLHEAAPLALTAVCDVIRTTGQFEEVRFVLFTSPSADAFARALDDQINAQSDLHYQT